MANTMTKLFVATTVTISAVAGASGVAFASNSGVQAVAEGQTVEQMLHHGIQDELTAQAMYQNIMRAFGVQRPFSSVLKSEQQHADMLKSLLNTYGVPSLEQVDPANVPTFATLEEALQGAVQLEKDNIAMYEKFLAQNPPEDVARVFASFTEASARHLAAFERALERGANETVGFGQGAERGQGAGNGQGTGIGNPDGAQARGQMRGEGTGVNCQKGNVQGN